VSACVYAKCSLFPCGLKLPKSKIFVLDVRWFFATLSVFSTMDLNDVNK